MRIFKNKMSDVRCQMSSVGDKGFTLVELLVSLTIILVLSATVVINIKFGSDEQALLRSAQKFAFDIRRAQNLALSPEKYRTNSVCFYGIKILDASSYSLYYDDQSTCQGATQFKGTSTELEIINLERGVQFDNNNLNDNIAFLPPEPIAYYNNISGFAPSKIIELSLINNPTRTKTVTINKFGNVEIQ